MRGITQIGQLENGRVRSESGGPVGAGFNQASASQVSVSADESAGAADADHLSNVDLILIFQGLLGARDES
jgi:hypothetical protein